MNTLETYAYKDVLVPVQLRGLIDHMSTVESYRVELYTLGQQWDLLTILGQMSGENMDMSATREGFKDLTSQLLSNLAREILKKTVQQATSKAQVAVDIVIRNLFERTADIGFLATDEDIRTFIRGGSKESEIRKRFAEYVAKYSVYDNIILLDPEGNVLTQLDTKNKIERSTDPLISEALNTKAPYVEVYRQSDLCPERENVLLYAYRVTENNDSTSRPLGVLVLCFRFENEMQGVFDNLSDEQDWSVISLLDSRGRVISSSDQYHVPLGAQLPLVLDENFKVIKFAGRSYLAKTCATRGYQGFMGLGWYGHVMLPLQHAFESDASVSLAIAPQVLSAVMKNRRLFSDDLQRIPRDAEVIQQELDRTVWNGNVRQDSDVTTSSLSAVRILLWEIGKTGRKTQSVFEESIGNLHQTVVSSSLRDVEFIAALIIDIMDRNLYERANDCRWWALTSRFSETLARSIISEAQSNEACAILTYINDLYTVYTNLILFDRSGTVVAVSKDTQRGLIGRKLEESWVRNILSLSNSQHYTVSDFEESNLYDARHTFIYGAAVRNPQGSETVGGIAIVFDSEPQFEAMIQESLPRTESGEVIEGSFGVLVDRSNKVISSTYEMIKPGEVLSLPLQLPVAGSRSATSAIISFKGQYYAVGARCSTGYREYKSAADVYHYEVIALVFIPLGEVEQSVQSRKSQKQVGIKKDNGMRIDATNSITYATFYIGDSWIGVSSDKVVEAISSEKLTPIPGSSDGIGGTIFYRGSVIPVIQPHKLFAATLPDKSRSVEIVVLATQKGQIGVIVDSLGEIIETTEKNFDNTHLAVRKEGSFLEGLIKSPVVEDGRTRIVLAINPTRLLARASSNNVQSVVDEVGELAQG